MWIDNLIERNVCVNIPLIWIATSPASSSASVAVDLGRVICSHQPNFDQQRHGTRIMRRDISEASAQRLLWRAYIVFVHWAWLWSYARFSALHCKPPKRTKSPSSEFYLHTTREQFNVCGIRCIGGCACCALDVRCVCESGGCRCVRVCARFGTNTAYVLPSVRACSLFYGRKRTGSTVYDSSCSEWHRVRLCVCLCVYSTNRSIRFVCVLHG